MIFKSLFKKSKKKSVRSFTLECDLHSHLIPGIDDGTKTMDESIEIIKELKNLGYKKIITTPHIMLDFYNNSSKTILDGLERLRSVLKEQNIDIEVEAASEYYMDEGLIKRLEQKDILTFGKNYLLFETSYVSKPFDFENMVFEIQAAGYIPVLAHPERYRYINKDLEMFKEFKNLGILFQCNINSFSGYYGKAAYENINILSENGLIDFLGSDIHKDGHLQILKKVLFDKKLNKVEKNNKILNNTL